MKEPILDPREDDIDPAIERLHLEEVRQRKLEVACGKVGLIDGEEVFNRVRALLK